MRGCPRAAQRRLLTLAVVAVTLVAAPAWAHDRPSYTDRKVPFGGVIVNACNGEAVVWEGWMRTESSARGDTVKTRLTFHGEGRGLTTGRRYSFGFSETTVVNASGTIFLRKETRLVSRGAPDMKIITVFKVNPHTGEVEADFEKMKCEDSKECRD
jgi:hypothetical protein